MPEMPDDLPLCDGMSEWFESMDPLVHKECAALCARCPAIDWCRNEVKSLVERGMLVEGTWAGELYGKKPATVRVSCGTPNGYYHHNKHGEEVCEPCMEAKRAAERRRTRVSRARERAAKASA